MAAFHKFDDYVFQEAKGTHDFSTHSYKIMLTNTAPVVTNSVKADLTEITAGSGYSAGGIAIPSLSLTKSSGTTTLTGNSVTFTASGGTMSAFRYAVMYNNTSSGKNLVGWWDYGANITLADGETFEWKPSNVSTAGTIFTKT